MAEQHAGEEVGGVAGRGKRGAEAGGGEKVGGGEDVCVELEPEEVQCAEFMCDVWGFVQDPA